MTIPTKILAAGGAAVALVTLALIAVVNAISTESRVQEFRSTMSSIVQQSEEVANGMDKMHAAKVFHYENLKTKAIEQAAGKPLKEAYAQTDLYLTIPVVAAWNSVKRAAKENGFTFTVPTHPKILARNKQNNIGERYQHIFDTFERGDKEYFQYDPKNKIVVFARPVRLSESCLTCHGNPANSPSGDGNDILGFPMENMKVGDIKGAFILEAPLTEDAKLAHTMQTMTLAGIGSFVVVLAAFGLLSKFAIARPLATAIEVIAQASRETGTASSEITSASHNLAAGASQQASALEETSASLEELSSMTKRNADSAQESNHQATEARSSSEQGSHDMNDLSDAMAEVGDIMKSIDEIAFQTNILALNAAVEAARAGEAGMGFAVVADEVRALAKRSADAAQETAEKLSHGQKLTEKVAASLTQIVTQVRKVDGLVTEIALASKEQAIGIQQINEAVSQMDEATQSNAACAEETSSSASLLQVQADALGKAVIRLEQMVGKK